mmetsp:Transcript_8559/g.10791  ORF Transcript_8559/g.10791 Transcript_8559/m.10791 type:complete len:209 (+) Transcript_8559:136-762(+)
MSKIKNEKLGNALMCDTFVTCQVIDYLTFPEIHKLVNLNKLSKVKQNYVVSARSLHLHSDEEWCETRSISASTSLLAAGVGFDRSRDNNTATRWVKLPAGLYANNKLRVAWCDQGWGNKRGKLHVVKEGFSAPNDYKKAAEGIIATIGLAPHKVQEEVIEFVLPQECDSSSYNLWYNCGGGGGHRLTIEEIHITSKTFYRKSDDNQKQ